MKLISNQGKILLIDNQTDLPSELAGLLFDEGYHVLNIADIDESYELIRNNNPDSVILNNFKEDDDMVNLQKLRIAFSGSLIVILISENTFLAEKLSTSFEPGTYSFILRPIANSDLLEKINLLIGKSIE